MRPLHVVVMLAPAYLHVQVMIQVLVDLLGVTVLAQQTAQHTQPPDPQQLAGQTSLTGTTTLT